MSDVTVTPSAVSVTVSPSSVAVTASSSLAIAEASESVRLYVRNRTGSEIAKGKAVYISGATGQTPEITLAQSNAYSTTDVIGVTVHAIADNAFGYVITQGILEKVDTQGITEGAPLYLSPTTAGALTDIEPTKPNWQMQVAYCLYANQNNGKILVRPNLESTKTEYIQDMTSVGESVSTAADQAAARSAIGVTYAASGETSSTKVVRADDSRLSDARTPTSHTHALSDLLQSGATTGQVIEWSGSAWAPADASGTTYTAGNHIAIASNVVSWRYEPAKRAIVESDLNALGDLTVANSGTAASTSFTQGFSSTASTMGIATTNTGTSSSGRSFVGLAASDQLQLGNGEVRCTCIMRTPATASDGTNRYGFRMGLLDTRTSGSVGDGLFFSYTDTVNGGNWTINAVSGGGAYSPIDTGIAMPLATWLRLDIIVNSAATEATFYIDDVLVHTETTTIPSGSSGALGAGWIIYKVLGTSSRNLFVDYWGISKEVVR